ncbi:MAG: hypothetical protein WCF84_04325 [Anaerolineae bacterium]
MDCGQIVDLPATTEASDFIKQIQMQHVSYILVGPSLMMETRQYIGLDPYLANIAIPTMAAHPEQFRVVFQDVSMQTFVYQVSP